MIVFYSIADLSLKSSCHVAANILDCGIIVDDFELPSHSYIYFQIKTLGKGMDSNSW